MESNHISQEITVFRNRIAPEKGALVGYGAIVEVFNLPVPLPARLALISEKRRKYQTTDWQVFTPRHQPQETLYDHLVFALKYEGLNLLLLKKLFQNTEKQTIEDWIKNEPFGRYSRKIWFLYEWLLQDQLAVPDLKQGNYVLLMNEEQQYAGSAKINSPRHRIRNNLPGTVNFCPLIFKTPQLENFIRANLSEGINQAFNEVPKDRFLQTSAFLLLKDSKASFTLGDEIATQNRAIRWGRIIFQAGNNSLSINELLRLQQIVIENNWFLNPGFRHEDGSTDERDRSAGKPVSEYISAQVPDIEILIRELLNTCNLLEDNNFHPVLTAAKIAFGFVFIRPFEEGNERIYLYLIHHLLSILKFTPQGIIFPVSSAILEKINDYRKILKNFFDPLSGFTEWRKNVGNNIDTIDYYRYFDATSPSEFLFECIDHAMNKIIPEEVASLHEYDSMRTWLDDRFRMPNKTVASLIRFLEQNNSKTLQSDGHKEVAILTDKEVADLENNFKLYFENI